ncbi:MULTISPECIES: hypothetical protein [unclassified Streptomyces]|uniref:hypothetical protein n=1 Tax=unclassified Streptomyces TaxID=2593676 RepID=UPI00130115DF|nr:hypothetical protein [Streptomyces sp. CB01580]
MTALDVARRLPVVAVYALRPLTPEVASALNPDVTSAHLRDSAAAIGYPQGAADA